MFNSFGLKCVVFNSMVRPQSFYMPENHEDDVGGDSVTWVNPQIYVQVSV